MYKVELKESHFPATASTALEPITIGEMLTRQCEAIGDRVALKELTMDGEVDRTWTYRQLLDDAKRLAGALAARHEQGARIAVYAPNKPEWALLEFASAFAGVTLVTVNPAYQKRELKFVLEQSRSEAIYYVEEFRGNPMGEIVDAVCAETPGVKMKVDLDDHDALYAGSAPLPEVKPSDIAQIQYTSGTTGFPKGALLHHFGLVQNARDTLDRLGCGEGGSAVHHMPLFHTTGCAVMMIGMIGLGGTQYLAPMFLPEMIARVIEREKLELVFGVPTMLVALIEEIEKTGRDMSSVVAVGSGGSMVAPELARKTEEVFGQMVGIIYGQTEASPVITSMWPEDNLEDKTQTIGQPMPHVDVSIRDVNTNAACPVGEQGEICCRGYLVMEGYNDNPDATAKAIDADGWLHTGDLGTMDARGYVKITGRVKEMIIRGGENLFPAEIENAMLEHDDIAEVAVVGVPDDKFGEQVACFMRARADAKPGASDLKSFIRDRLSPQKTPVYWIWVDEWPLTGSGKIQKFKLTEAFEQGAYEPLTA